MFCLAEGAYAMAVIMDATVSTNVLAAPAIMVPVQSCLNFSYLYIGFGDVNLSILSKSNGKLFSVMTTLNMMWRSALVTLPVGSSGIQFIASGRDAAVVISQVTVLDGECPLGGNKYCPVSCTFDFINYAELVRY